MNSRYGNTNGEASLRAKLAHWYGTELDIDLDEGEFLITNGAKQALVITLMALCDPGDEIAIPVPYWPSYLDMAQLLGLKVRLLSPGDNHASKPDVDHWLAQCTDQTKILVYSSPSNPTGAVLSPTDIAKLASWSQRRDRWLIADEIYQFLHYDNELAAPSVLNLPVHLTRRIVHVSSASKVFSLMGQRVGWIKAPQNVIDRCSSISSTLAGNVSTSSQALATAALSTPRGEVRTRSEQLRQQRDRLCSELAATPWLRWMKPPGGLFVWCELPPTLDGTTIAKALLEDEHVAVLPGHVFGNRQAIRLSFTETADTIAIGINRIAEWARRNGLPHS